MPLLKMLSLIKSPVGLPVRVLKTPLVQRVLAGGREKFKCPYRCLRTCNPGKVPFCIAKALLSTWAGDIENGLYHDRMQRRRNKKDNSIKRIF